MLTRDLQELCIYNNGKHWALKRDQVTCDFAPPGTTGQPTPGGEGLPYGAPARAAQVGPVGVKAFPQGLILMQPGSLRLTQ